MSTPYPKALSQALDHSEIKVELVDEMPAGQCEWCQMIGALCCVSVEWVPRPDVMSVGASESCLGCARHPVRWALDDALVGSLIRVSYAGGVPA
ncbi:hypothetical protein [Saccharopolyspora sp. NPDC002376]